VLTTLLDPDQVTTGLRYISSTRSAAAIVEEDVISAQSKPRGKVRAQLDEATILDAAIRLAATPGTESLTVRELGTELGADPTAIYRHFRDKDHLVRAVHDRLIVKILSGVAMEPDWRARLTKLADLTVEVLSAHPSIGAQASARNTGGAGELRAIEMITTSMLDAGLDQTDAVRYYAVYVGYVLSMASAQANHVLLEKPLSGRDDSAWIGDLPALDPSTYPSVALLRHDLVALRNSDVFAAGVEMILDAVEDRAAATMQLKRSRRRR
jgi:AcrR family transcriptional regulator